MISDFPSRLIRFEVDSIESRIRPLRFSFARSSSPLPQLARRDLGDLLVRDLEAVGEVLRARSDVEADQPRVGVLRRERVDGVGHAALLPDLLEEARGGRAAEQRVEERRGEAAPVGARDPRGADADVVLLGLLALEADARPRRAHERRAQPRPARRRFRLLALRLLERADERRRA